ncbi:hypothetical protein HanRHA438_Chr11g0505771 [Helianthus annuus]|nr:hypothetical protein HanRHA438_Chr11g0505771 [Helianthus annuus]
MYSNFNGSIRELGIHKKERSRVEIGWCYFKGFYLGSKRAIHQTSSTKRSAKRCSCVRYFTFKKVNHHTMKRCLSYLRR